MNEQRTVSILRRVPVILAVTAASYGLPAQGQVQRVDGDREVRHGVPGAAAATALDRMREEAALQD